jgi:hypothetical protein
MAHGVAPISPLVASCAVIPFAMVVMILFPDTSLLRRNDDWQEQISGRLKQMFFAARLSLMERIISGIWHGYL